jgi:hypothetical protein
MNENPTYTELDKLAVGFIDGAFSLDDYKSLSTLNQFMVLSMSGLYACAKIGLCSGKKVAENKYKLINEYKLFATNLMWIGVEHSQWVKRTKETSSKLCELAKAINNKDTNAFSLALQIIDLLTQDDVYNQLLFNQENTENFQAECMQTLIKNETYFFETFGDIPFVDLLTKFFNSVKENNLDEIFKELDADNIRKFACRVPVKKDSEQCKGIYDSYCRLLGMKK